MAHKQPGRHTTRDSRRLLTESVEELHRLLGWWGHDERPGDLSDLLGESALQAWDEALTLGVSPHLCTDRYCHCHVVLADYQPPELLGLEQVTGSAWGSGGKPLYPRAAGTRQSLLMQEAPHL